MQPGTRTGLPRYDAYTRVYIPTGYVQQQGTCVCRAWTLVDSDTRDEAVVWRLFTSAMSLLFSLAEETKPLERFEQRKSLAFVYLPPSYKPPMLIDSPTQRNLISNLFTEIVTHKTTQDTKQNSRQSFLTNRSRLSYNTVDKREGRTKRY